MIKAVFESGNSQNVYNLCIILAFIGVFALNLWYSRKYGISKKQSVIASLWILCTTYGWIYILTWAESGFQSFGGKNLVRGLVYIPVFAYPIARLLKIDWLRMCDFFAPCGCLAQGINKIGCVFAGCCYGYPWKYGICNPVIGGNLVPIQLVEGFGYFTICYLVIKYAKQRRYTPTGLSFTLMLILYGTSRFFFEFARHNRKIFLGCSPTAFHALFMAVTGTIAAIYLTEKIRFQKTQSYPRNTKPRKNKKR